MQIPPNVITHALVMHWSKSSPGCQAAIVAPVMPEEHKLHREQAGDGSFQPETEDRDPQMSLQARCENATFSCIQEGTERNRSKCTGKETKQNSTDKQGKDRNLVRYILPPLAERAKTFTLVTSLWQNRLIIITLTATPLDLSRPISHHRENRPSCSSSSNVTTFDPRCKTASLINWESRSLPDCATPTGLSTAFWGHTCRNSLFEVPDGNKAQNDKHV